MFVFVAALLKISAVASMPQVWETEDMSLPPRPRRTTLSPHLSSYVGMGDLLVGRRKQSILVVDDNTVNATC